MSDLFLEIGTTISIEKNELNNIFAHLVKMGYELIGPKAKDHTVIHIPISNLSELPLGYNSIQEAGKYKLVQNGHQNYFNYVHGPQGWKP